MRRIVVLGCLLFSFFAAGTAGAASGARSSWAAPQIRVVVDAGLMAPSVSDFRPDDPLTQGELATVLASLGMEAVTVVDPDRPVTIRELDARLVTAAELRPAARAIRLKALDAGLVPTQWLGTETVARMLGFRVNHLQSRDELERQLRQPATRAEAAYSIARLLTLQQWETDAVQLAVNSFELPGLTVWQQAVLARALRFVGTPYVFAGTSERPQQLFGRRLPGGFDCSGFVWRVYKVEPFPGGAGLATVLKGRTSMDMSGEVPRTARIQRQSLRPGDLVFFGPRGPQSKPAEVDHMGIYVGDGWMVHASNRGTTLTPMTAWYETRFAWGRRPLAEAGLE